MNGNDPCNAVIIPFVLSCLLFTMIPARDAGAQLPADNAPVRRGPNLVLKNQIMYPTRLAIDADDKVYVTDIRVGSVFVLDRLLNPVREMRGMASPMGIAVDEGGRIYVGNQGRGNVEVYDREGNLLWYLGSENGEFSMPTDIVVVPDGRAYVVDSRENCVKVYNPGGERIQVIGVEGNGDGEFSFPSTIALSIDAGELYVGDQGNHRIQVFDLDGNFLRWFGGYVGSGQFDGRFVAVQSVALVPGDGGTRVHVVDTSQNWIQVLTGTGEFIEAYGETGREIGQLNLPLDIAVNSDGRVIVCNSGNGRVEVIR